MIVIFLMVKRQNKYDCAVALGTRYNVINLERKIEKQMLSAIIVEYKMCIKWFSYDKNE